MSKKEDEMSQTTGSSEKVKDFPTKVKDSPTRVEGSPQKVADEEPPQIKSEPMAEEEIPLPREDVYEDDYSSRYLENNGGYSDYTDSYMPRNYTDSNMSTTSGDYTESLYRYQTQNLMPRRAITNGTVITSSNQEQVVKHMMMEPKISKFYSQRDVMNKLRGYLGRKNNAQVWQFESYLLDSTN